MQKTGVIWRQRREDCEISLAEERGCRTYACNREIFEQMSQNDMSEGCYVTVDFCVNSHKIISMSPVKFRGKVQKWSQRYAFVHACYVPQIKMGRNKRVEEYKTLSAAQNIHFTPNELEFDVETDSIIHFEICVNLSETRKNKNSPHLDLIAKNIEPSRENIDVPEVELLTPKNKNLTSWFDKRMSNSPKKNCHPRFSRNNSYPPHANNNQRLQQTISKKITNNTGPIINTSIFHATGGGTTTKKSEFKNHHQHFNSKILLNKRILNENSFHHNQQNDRRKNSNTNNSNRNTNKNDSTTTDTATAFSPSSSSPATFSSSFNKNYVNSKLQKSSPFQLFYDKEVPNGDAKENYEDLHSELESRGLENERLKKEIENLCIKLKESEIQQKNNSPVFENRNPLESHSFDPYYDQSTENNPPHKSPIVEPLHLKLINTHFKPSSRFESNEPYGFIYGRPMSETSTRSEKAFKFPSYPTTDYSCNSPPGQRPHVSSATRTFGGKNNYGNYPQPNVLLSPHESSYFDLPFSSRDNFH